MRQQFVLIIPMLLLVSSLDAATPQPVPSDYKMGESLYEYYGCSSCHGRAGKDALPGTPVLAGQDETYLLNQLKDFKSGARNNGMSPIMTAYLKDVTEQELRQMSHYLAAQ